MATASHDHVTLREVHDDDLPLFFDHQRDPQAAHMAAFTVKDPSDLQAFHARWNRLRRDATVTLRTILFDHQVAGHVALFGPPDEREVTYWIAREFWGHGIATQALSQFLRTVPARPLYARVASDNLASLRVLEKSGFTISGHGRFHANARGAEVDEVILTLNPAK
jgi:RimJ/RimL family protein N-acetyltransferase